MPRIASLLFTAALFACGSSESEPKASSLPPLELASKTKEGVASKGDAPVLKGPRVMTRGERPSVRGQAELLAACVDENKTPGAATIEVTVVSGAVSAARTMDAGGTDAAFTTCLTTRAIGMPHATDGTSTLTLTAM